MASEKLSIEEMATYCKAKGFVYPNSEIYGGFAGFFDYGPLGVEIKNALKQSWWKFFVQNREDVVGIDGTILSHPKVWKASGHVDCFSDKMIFCQKNNKMFRADNLVEEILDIQTDGMSEENLLKNIEDNRSKFEDAGYDLAGEMSDFNLMFKTNVGPMQSEDAIAYLRPETAQLIFTNFKMVADTCRVKLPFGIAQIGKAFRNEISPRDFLFRTREFEQMEIEYFIHPDQEECPFYDDEVKKFEFQIITSDQQLANEDMTIMTAEEMVKNKLAGEWHVYWLKENYQWFLELGVKPENIRLREHLPDERAHYSSSCFDIEYKFPFGFKEIHGNANRGQFDLTQHKKVSGKKIEIFDEESKSKVLPKVIEPSQGVDRAFLSIMYDAYEKDDGRGNAVLKISPLLAPIKVTVLPLVNKLNDQARGIFERLKKEFVCSYDKGGSVGRRYARSDEIGTPYCVTLDFDGLEDNTVTIRDRDTTKQIRVKVDDLKTVIRNLLAGDDFKKSGELIN